MAVAAANTAVCVIEWRGGDARATFGPGDDDAVLGVPADVGSAVNDGATCTW